MIGRLLARKDGNIAIAFALMAGPLTLGGALALDTTAMMRESEAMQNALDSALLAIAVQPETDHAVLTALGENVLAGNSGLSLEEFDFTYIGEPSDEQAAFYGIPLQQAGDYRLATVSFDFDGDFGLFPTKTIERVAAIVPVEESRFCVLALDETGDGAIQFTGNATLKFADCDIVANSSGSPAIALTGNFEIEANCIRAVGTIDRIGNFDDGLACGQPEEGVARTVDPYDGLQRPDPDEAPIPSNEDGKKIGGKLVFEPGRYDDLKLSGNLDIELQPGNYIVTGKLTINGNSSIVGEGVTFFLGPDAEVSINGNSNHDLTAPTEGDYAGFLFIALEGHGAKLKINGNSDARLSGTFYLPGSDIEYSGNSDSANTCVSIIAHTVKFTGNTKITSDCAAYDETSTEARFRLAL